MHTKWINHLFLLLVLFLALLTAAMRIQAHTQTAADHYRKPGQMQLIEYQLKSDVEPFELVDLTLTILEPWPYKISELELTVKAESGLVIVQKPVVNNDKAWRMQFKARGYGRHYLNVYVRERNVNNLQRFIPKVRQIFSIPVQVGEADQ